MKNKYLILGIIVFVYLAAIFSFMIISDNNIKYIIFPDGECLKYKKRWEKVDVTDTPNKNYKIIKNGKFYLTSKLKVGEKITFNNENLQEEMFAYRGGNIGHINYSIEDIKEEDYVFLNNLLSEKEINADTKNISYLIKFVVDLNNDNMVEEVYAVSNHYNSQVGDLFTLILIKYQSEYAIIELDKFETEYQAYLPYIFILDVNGDKFGDLILRKRYSSMMGQTTKIMSFKNGFDNYEKIYDGGKIWN